MKNRIVYYLLKRFNMMSNLLKNPLTLFSCLFLSDLMLYHWNSKRMTSSFDSSSFIICKIDVFIYRIFNSSLTIRSTISFSTFFNKRRIMASTIILTGTITSFLLANSTNSIMFFRNISSLMINGVIMFFL